MAQPDKDYRIYLPQERLFVSVTHEVYQAYYQPIWRIYDHAKRRGACSCPNWQYCYGDCGVCAYQKAGDMRSLDYICEGQEGGSTTLADILPNDSPGMEDIVLLRTVLEDMLAELDELEKDGSRIFIMLSEGYTEREIASWLGISQSTLSYRKNKLIKRNRERHLD